MKDFRMEHKTVQKMEFGTFEPKKPVNEYTQIVEQLAEAGENASVTITVLKSDAEKARYKMQRAANAIDKTARLRETVEFADAVEMTFTLTEKFKGRWSNVGDK